MKGVAATWCIRGCDLIPLRYGFIKRPIRGRELLKGSELLKGRELFKGCEVLEEIR